MSEEIDLSKVTEEDRQKAMLFAMASEVAKRQMDNVDPAKKLAKIVSMVTVPAFGITVTIICVWASVYFLKLLFRLVGIL